MSRPLRIEYPDASYHVMSRARLGQEAFPAREDYYNSFIDLLKSIAIERIRRKLEGNKFKRRYEQIIGSL